jgi:flagellar biosynthesis GTPase FlhF
MATLSAHPKPHFHRSRRCYHLRKVLLLLTVLLSSCTNLARAQEAYDDYVNEVLDEAARDYRDDGYAHSDDATDGMHDQEEKRRQEEEEELHRQEEEMLRRQEEEERIIRERVQTQIEEAFEAELRQMTAENQKAARKQKKKDARIVRRVLRAAKKDDHYGVLGLRNIEFRILATPHSIKIGSFEWTIPSISLFHISAKSIKRAYRDKARLVHPDKNRDGRADLAFLAVDNAASILSDEQLRDEYDEQVRELRGKRNANAKHLVGKAVSGTLGVANQTVSVFRKVLGPFAFPIFILGSLIV